MYTLMRENVERTVSNIIDKDRLLAKGFTLRNTVLDSKTINSDLEDMSIEELKQYAEENNIDLGRTNSKNGIIEKIKQSQL